MKKKIGKISIVVLCTVAIVISAVWLVSAVQAIPRNAERVAHALINAQIAARFGCSGNVFFVDSAVGGTEGTSWGTAVATWNEGIALCTANNNDLILGAAGHSEDLTANDGVDCDVAGIKIVGLGSGGLMSKVVYTNAAGEWVIGAADITIENIQFVTSVTAVVSGLSVEAAGDDFRIIGCRFGFPETVGTDEFNYTISLEAGADRGLIKDCYINNGAGTSVCAIWLNAVSGLTVENTFIQGDYSSGCISGFGASDDIVLMRNTFFNGTMGGDNEINTVRALGFVDGTSGYIADNRIISDVATALLMRIGDDMVFMNNIVSDTDGDEFSGSIESGVFIEAAADVETTSISPHTDG